MRLWAWLADWYRYQAREHAALAPGSPEAAFYRRAADEYRAYLRQPVEEHIDVIEGSDPPRRTLISR